MSDADHWIAATIAFLLSFALGFGASRLKNDRAKALCLATILFSPFLLIVVATTVSVGAVGALLIYSWIAILILFLPVAAWLFGTLVGFDIGRRTTREYRENRYR